MSQEQLIDKLVDVLASTREQVPAARVVRRTVGLPQFQFIDRVVGRPGAFGYNFRHVNRSWRHRRCCTSSSLSMFHRF